MASSGDMRSPNVRAYLTRKQDVETRLPGVSLIQQVHASDDIVLVASTGADPGTGEVTLALAVSGVVPGQYNTFIVDAKGRITKAWNTVYKSGGGGGGNGSISNQNTYEQSASFWIGGSGKIGGAFEAGSIVSGPIEASAVSISTPLDIASGGTGVNSTEAHYVLAGPAAGNTPAAPVWRPLNALDLPDYPWSRITTTPTTVAGYGIVDVYTRSQSDARYLNIPLGLTTQYLRGDKNWATITTDVVAEASQLYFTDARARDALSATGSNLSYAPATGIMSFTTLPVFDSVTLSNPPTQANHAATKSYVDTAVESGIARSSVDRFAIVNSGTTAYTLTSVPTAGSTQVYLNGVALFEGVVDDYTVSSNTVTLNASVVLTVGDVLHVRYHY